MDRFACWETSGPSRDGTGPEQGALASQLSAGGAHNTAASIPVQLPLAKMQTAGSSLGQAWLLVRMKWFLDFNDIWVCVHV